jgi:hypothetical protein
MSMSSSSDSPIELDAEQSPERLLLTSPVSTAVRRELLVYQRNESSQTIRIVEEISSVNGTQSSRDKVINFLDLRQDSVLPLYTIASQPRVEWNMEVIYGKGSLPVVYSFREREDIFRLQGLFTGYKPAAYFENVICSVIFKKRLVRDSQHNGCGEIQLWWPESKPGNSMPSVSPTPSRSSQHGIAIPSIILGSVHPTSVASVQTNFTNGKDVLVSVPRRPPLLVAFLEDDCGYTMLKTHSKF